MDTKQTLVSMFEANKQALEKELTGLLLPKDANKVQGIVSKYLNTMFENDGDYRQNLTLSEDYILIAAIELLNAQQSIAKEIMKEMNEEYDGFPDGVKKKGIEKEKYPYILAGSAIGTAIGGVLGTWAALLGAVAGTAIILYGVSVQSENQQAALKMNCQNTNSLIDTHVFTDIIKKVCEKIDNLINVFRIQVQNAKNACSNNNKSSIKKDYSFLIDAIEGLMIAANLDDGNANEKLDDLLIRINLLSKALTGYGLEFVGDKIVSRG